MPDAGDLAPPVSWNAWRPGQRVCFCVTGCEECLSSVPTTSSHAIWRFVRFTTASSCHYRITTRNAHADDYVRTHNLQELPQFGIEEI